MFLAINEILKEKSRFFLITIVIILVSYLAFFLTALAYGLASSYTQALEKWDASGIILNENANDVIGRSILIEPQYKTFLSDNVAPLGVSSATVEANKQDDVALFGIDKDTFLLPEVSEGSRSIKNNEVLASSKLKAVGVNLGDNIKLQGSSKTYKVSGFVDNATFQTAPVIYMSLDEWRSTTSEVSGMTSMRDDTTISALATRDKEKPEYFKDGMKWQSLSDFAFTLPGYQPQVLTFSLMIGFLIGIAAFVLAIFMYILTMQKKSIFGVLKAEGVPNSYIGSSVIVQVLILSIVGLLIGMVLALITGIALASKVPFVVNPIFYVGITLLFLICAVIGALASVRSVVKIDPVEAIG